MKRVLISFLLIAIVVGVPFAGGAREDQEQVFQFRLAHIDPPTHPHHLASERFADLVAERTDGMVQIEVYPAGQLGNAPSIMEQLQLGTIAMFQGGVGWWGSSVPDYWLVASNFVYDNTEHSLAVMNGEIGDDLAARLLDRTGVRVLTQGLVRNPRHLLTVTPVRTLDDLSGLNIRVPEMQNWMVPWEALGANPTPMPLPETYLGLQQGVVEGTEHEWPQLLSNNFSEVAKYATETYHQYETAGFFIAEEVFESLPARYQDVLVQAALDAEAYNNELQASFVEEARERMRTEHGVEFIPVDIEPWYEVGRDIMLNVVSPQLGFTSGLLERIWDTDY